MTDLIGRTLHRLGGTLPGRLSMPGDDRYAAATAIWPKPVGPMPRAVVHCRTPRDVQSTVRAARDGEDWRELARRVREAVARLPETNREVLLMRTFEGLSFAEVAYVLHLDAATARKRHGRALLRLHKLLTNDDQEDAS